MERADPEGHTPRPPLIIGRAERGTGATAVEPEEIDGEDIERDFHDLAEFMRLPLVRIDEAVRLDYEQNRCRDLRVDRIWPLNLGTRDRGVVLATAPPETPPSSERGWVHWLQPYRALVLVQRRPGETAEGADPPEPLPLDRVYATYEAFLYFWRLLGPHHRQPPSHPRMWLAAWWWFHVDGQGRMVRLPGPPRPGAGGSDHPAFYARSSRDMLLRRFRRAGMQVEDGLVVDADELAGLLGPMLSALAMWRSGEAVLDGEHLRVSDP